MSLQNAILAKALQLKQLEKQKNEYSYEARLIEARQNEPLLCEIEKQLNDIGLKTVSAAIKGETESLNELKKESERLIGIKNGLLKKAGATPPLPCCPACGDEFYIDGKLCGCVTALAKQLQIEALSEQTPIKNCTFQSFKLSYYPDDTQNKMSALLSFTKDYAESFTTKSQSLLFMGKSGLGKTHISLSIADVVIKKGYNVQYHSAQNLFSAIEKEHFSYGSEQPSLDSALGCDLLILDDLGAEFSTSFTNAALYNIVNTRILSGKPTLINTNLEFMELESRYTARITSRFLGEYIAKKFVGNDIRQLKALEKM